MFLQCHVGILGAHRNAEKTLMILQRQVWWLTMKSDLVSWVNSCITCLRFRKMAQNLPLLVGKARRHGALGRLYRAAAVSTYCSCVNTCHGPTIKLTVPFAASLWDWNTCGNAVTNKDRA